MSQDTQVLRPTAGARALCVPIYLTGLLLLRLYLPFGIPDYHRLWIIPVFALGGLFWLADVFTTRIVLGPQNIRIVSSLHSQTISRTKIDSVSWAKGCRVSLLLQDGTVVRLPNMGRTSQGLTNTVRAWLRKSEVAS
jgi:hypothetical protein